MKIKKLISLMTAFIISISFIAVNVDYNADALNFVPPFDVYSEAVYLMNLDTGEVIYRKNENTQLVPASLTKIMTLVVILEDYKDKMSELRSKYATATSQSFDELYLTGCSNADIRIGESVSYMDLMYALILRSACEAANILAIDSYGSLQGFINRMNELAEELGLESTHFSNTHGLFPTDNYTSAADMAKLTAYAIDTYPMFTEISCAASYEMEATSYHLEPRTISHTNYMMSPGNGGENYYQYVRGIKTGTLDEAGRCLVSMASKDGYTYLLVTLNAPQKDSSGNNVFYNFIDHKNVYEWAFSNFSYTEILNKNEEITSVSVQYGDGADVVNLKTAEGFSQIWQTSVDISTIQRVITKRDNVVAPVQSGDVLGSVELRVAGETMAVIDLVAVKTIERDVLKEKLEIAKSFIGSKRFKLAIWISVGFFILYTLLFIVYLNVRSKKMRNRYRSSLRNVPRQAPRNRR